MLIERERPSTADLLFEVKYVSILFYKKQVKNEGESAASFCCQVAAWVPVMFCNFCWVKNHKIIYYSANTEAGEKISTDLESLEFQKFFDVFLTKLKNNQILLNKISHRFLVSTNNQAIYWVKEPHLLYPSIFVYPLIGPKDFFVGVLRPYFLLCATLLWMSCEQPRQVYA